jgi:hypothetical protein
MRFLGDEAVLDEGFPRLASLSPVKIIPLLLPTHLPSSLDQAAHHHVYPTFLSFDCSDRSAFQNPFSIVGTHS